MRDFFQFADRIFFDEAICKKFEYPNDFDSKLFKDFLHTAGISDVLAEETILSNLQLVTDEHHFKNGTILFFGKEPQKFYHQAVTRCLLFKGVNKTHIIDDKIFSGNLIQQYNNALAFLFQKLNINYLVFGLFLRMGLAEKVGSGINRMKDEMAKANLPEPVFSLEGFFTAKFYRPIHFDKWILNWSNTLNTPLIKMLGAFHKNPEITKPELSNILGQGKTSVDNYIAQLKSLGILIRQGSRKTGKWIINLVPPPVTG